MRQNILHALIWPLNFLFLILISPIISFCCVPILSHAATVQIEGRIFTESGTLPGATVSVYKNFGDIGANKPFLTSSPSNVQGVYTLLLESGAYYFTATGTADGKKFSAYHGANPLTVDTKKFWVALMAHEEKPPVYEDGITSVQGVVTYNGKHVSQAHIAFYTLDAKKFKGLGFLAEKGLGFMRKVNDDGTFNFPLVPGKYVVIARRTKGGNEIRPLEKGDLFCYAPANPVEVRPDQIVRIEVPCHPKADRNSFVQTPKIKANDFATVDSSGQEAKSGIMGKVTDTKGNPVPGIYVIAYQTGDTSTPTREAENISQTDADGNYFIPLNTDGNYGLVVRSTLGEAPKVDDPTGLYNKNIWQGISFKAGELIENIDINTIDSDRKLFE